MTREFIIELSSIIPFEAQIDALKDLISEYQESPSEETKHAIYTGAMLLAIKSPTDNKGADKVIKDINNIERAVKFFKTNKN